jgi:carboxymethylenebutenolidase
MRLLRSGGLRDTADLYKSGTRNATFKAGGEEVPAYFASKLAKPFSGVIVLQEWWGLNASIQKTADIIAKSNYCTIVPDLFRGRVAKDNEDAGNLMNHLDFPKAIEDIRGAAAYLKEKGCQRVGVIGFAMGGALVVAAAASENSLTDISSGTIFHGIPDLSKLKPENIKWPIQAHFGLRDNLKGFSDPETAEKLEKWLKSANVDATFYRYERAGHAFTNQDRPEVYNEYASKLAWMRAFAFFNKHLNMPTFDAMAKEREAREAAAKAAAEETSQPNAIPSTPPQKA